MKRISRKKFSIKRRVKRLFEVVTSPIVRINPDPVIILGHQKSGTTAIAALTAARSASSVTLDIRGIYEPIETMIHAGQLTIEQFVQLNRHDFSRDIIKEPSLTFLYAELKRVFPRARFMMIVRDPRDNIRSILNRLNLRGDLEDVDINAASDIDPEWKLVFDGQWLGLQGDTYIEVLAARWSRAADIYLEHMDEMLLLRYEDFVVDKVGSIEHVIHQLHLKGVNDISDKVNVQYQPRGNRDVSWEQFFGHQNLVRIEKICRSRMMQFGYEPRAYLTNDEPASNP